MQILRDILKNFNILIFFKIFPKTFYLLYVNIKHFLAAFPGFHAAITSKLNKEKHSRRKLKWSKFYFNYFHSLSHEFFIVKWVKDKFHIIIRSRLFLCLNKSFFFALCRFAIKAVVQSTINPFLYALFSSFFHEECQIFSFLQFSSFSNLFIYF